MRPKRSGPDPDMLSILYLLGRLLVALRYLAERIYQRLAAWFPGGRLPWFKLALAGVLLWLAMKRDLQFQVNLRNPGGLSEAAAGTVAPAREEKGKRVLNALVPMEEERFAASPGDTDEDRRNKAYIRRFRDVAKTEMDKYGIPASVKMAQALHESQAGTSRLATKNNNHFGIKCFSSNCKKGHCANFSDDHHKDFFRSYSSAWESWRAHSQMIAGGKYKKLINHGKDYKAWVKGLKELGYATDPRYEQKLLNYIEKYRLYTLD
jgi:hypothetical protein